MDEQEILYTLALTQANQFTLAGLAELYRQLGSAKAVMEHRRDIRAVLPDATDRLCQVLADVDRELPKAEAELRFCTEQGVTPLTMSDPRYPQRLRECTDAPLMLFLRGQGDLNPRRVVCIVGTRHATVYGQDLIRRLTEGLARQCPDLLIVSGLAYGIDICAHREALRNGCPTVAVLAHGQDDLYPPRHRKEAREMVARGGLLTEFVSGTRIEKVNFVRRNRIVAGMSDVCVLVESAARGGGLITCRLARSYQRDVMAFPGPVGAPYSEGCNQLIRDQEAQLITSADDLVKAMGWQDDAQQQTARQQGIERQLFPQLSAEEQQVVNALLQTNDQPVNQLATRSGLPVAQLQGLLFQLEMKGMVRNMAGGLVHLLQ